MLWTLTLHREKSLIRTTGSTSLQKAVKTLGSSNITEKTGDGVYAMAVMGHPRACNSQISWGVSTVGGYQWEVGCQSRYSTRVPFVRDEGIVVHIVSVIRAMYDYYIEHTSPGKQRRLR